MNTKDKLQRNISSSSLILPNGILIFGLIYFGLIIEQKTEESYFIRNYFYYVLILLDILALAYINADFFYFKSANKSFSIFLRDKFFRLIGKKIPEEEKLDEIREFVEKSVYDNILNQDQFKDNYRPGYQSNLKTYTNREKEIISSRAKSICFLILVDERHISGKLISPSKSPFGGVMFGSEYAPKNQFTKFSQFNMPNQEYNISTASPSYRILKSLQLSHRYITKLKTENEINKDNFIEDMEVLGLYNYERWIENFKTFLSQNIIGTVLDDHYENIDLLNRYLESSLSVHIVESMTDPENDGFFHEFSQKISDTNLNFSSVNVKNFNLKGQFISFQNNIQNVNHSSGFNLIKDSVNDKQFMNVFFGDNDKIKFIIDKIEEKLHSIKIQKDRARIMQNRELNEFREKGLTGMLFSSKKDIQEKSDLPYGNKKKMHLNNPLKNANKLNLMSDYADLLESHNTSIEENLKILKQILILRIELNSKLNPLFIKIDTVKHSQILLEYVVWRLKELRNNNFNDFKNDSGGNFYEENWMNCFSSDSQTVASIFIKYMEEIYEENDIRQRTFLVNWPLEPKLEKNSKSLIMNQINPPTCEPHFNVSYEDNVYSCLSGKENFFYAAVVFMSLMKMKMSNIVNKLKIDDFITNIFKY